MYRLGCLGVGCCEACQPAVVLGLALQLGVVVALVPGTQVISVWCCRQVVVGLLRWQCLLDASWAVPVLRGVR